MSCQLYLNGHLLFLPRIVVVDDILFVLFNCIGGLFCSCLFQKFLIRVCIGSVFDGLLDSDPYFNNVKNIISGTGIWSTEKSLIRIKISD